MSAPASRRGFLRGLTTLPFIGGGVALIGAPSAVAEPCTPALLLRYADWLATEYGEALIEAEPLTHPQRLIPIGMDADRWSASLRPADDRRPAVAGAIGDELSSAPIGITHPQHMRAAQDWRREWCRNNMSIALRATEPEKFLRPPALAPSTRAALVLSAVGYDWREGGR